MSFWTKLRDTVESAGVLAGNYLLPGSGLVTENLASKGSQEQLNSDIGKLAMIGTGVGGGYAGNLSNYGSLYDSATGALGGGTAANPAAAFSATTPTGLAALPADVAGAGGTVGAAAGGASALGGYGVPAAILGSSLLGANAAKQAANIQAAGQTEANQLARDIFNQQVAWQTPYQQAGVGALNNLVALNQGGPDAAQKFLTMDPGYNFRLSEGLKALDRSAAARGGLLSGATLKGAQQYGQNMASQEYANAYNRLSQLAGIGQTATGQASNAAQNFGTTLGSGLTNLAAVNAAGTMGQANAIGSGLGQYLNYSSNQDLSNALATRRSAYAP